MRILIINPNTNEGVRQRLEDAARSVGDADDTITAICAPSGIDLIVSEADQEKASRAVLECARQNQDHFDGIIIGSFGDTGIELVRDTIDLPTVGIADAAIKAALSFEGRPTIISFSETMRPSFQTLLRKHGLSDAEVAIHLLPGRSLPEAGLIADQLHQPLLELAKTAAEETPSCLVTGGGPLAGLARRLRPALDVHVVDGTEEAVKLLRREHSCGLNTN